ncbi:MAG: type II toxin-antitoxin system VapC family toxin, partial [Ktedonobacterales bacterium]
IWLMRILFDINVVLDVLLKRDPWRAEASQLWDAVAQGKLEGFLAPTTITTVYYLARKLPAGSAGAKQAITACLSTFEICAMDHQTLDAALSLPGSDFEDSVQIACAHLTSLDGIVTRNAQDFASAQCTVYTPAQLLAQLP